MVSPQVWYNVGSCSDRVKPKTIKYICFISAKTGERVPYGTPSKNSMITSSYGIVALYGPFYYFFLRTIGLRFSLYQKLSKLRKKNLAPLFCQFLSWNRVRERSNIYFLFLFLPCNCLLHHVEDYAMTFGLRILVELIKCVG